MIIVNVHEAKSQLSKLLKRVISGEEVIIARNNEPIARLEPYVDLKAEKRGGFGLLKDEI